MPKVSVVIPTRTALRYLLKLWSESSLKQFPESITKSS
jgi:hypothetical protein